MHADFVIQDWHVHHAGQEAFICVDGDLEVVVDGVRTTIAPGEFALIPLGAQHTFSSGRGGHVIAVMSAEIAELIEAIHAELTDQERAVVWDRYRSSLVGS
jgi:mannose-6-phosphate isomerase-like protein (cupin superfamily)